MLLPIFHLSTDMFVMILLFVMSFLIRNRTYHDVDLKDGDEYDIIVYGGGTSGCILAANLARSLPDAQILLLNEGGQPTVRSKIPWLHLIEDPEAVVAYPVESQENALLAAENHTIKITRARILGGIKAIDTMVHVRGNPQDYSYDGWGYENVMLPLFKEMEHVNNVGGQAYDDEYRGHDGPMNVQHATFRGKIAEKYLEAAEEIGYRTGDYNGRDQAVFGLWQYTIKKGLRVNTENTYLRKAADELSNLKISFNTIVCNVIIDGKNQTTGVQVMKDGERLDLKVKKEVILTAGAIESAAVLLRSGIGPSDHLGKIGIPVKQDLPVGQNFHDHVVVEGLSWLVNCTNWAYDVNFHRNTDAILQYALTRGGPVTLPLYGQTVGFIASGLNLKDRPDLKLVCSGTSLPNTLRVLGSRKYFKKEVYESYLKPWEGKPALRIAPVLSRPRSRGTIELRSKDPTEMPIIKANYLDDKVDVNALLHGIKEARKIIGSKTLSECQPEFSGPHFKFCKEHEADSDDFWRCYIRWMATTEKAPAGTCRMGPEGYVQSVVGSDLRVHGVKGLRVADASVFRASPTGNFGAALAAIGLRAANLIIAGWQKQA